MGDVAETWGRGLPRHRRGGRGSASPLQNGAARSRWDRHARGRCVTPTLQGVRWLALTN